MNHLEKCYIYSLSVPAMHIKYLQSFRLEHVLMLWQRLKSVRKFHISIIYELEMLDENETEKFSFTTKTMHSGICISSVHLAGEFGTRKTLWSNFLRREISKTHRLPIQHAQPTSLFLWARLKINLLALRAYFYWFQFDFHFRSD